MKRIFILLLCLFVLSSSTCNKKSEECHYEIIIKNNSNDTIVNATRSTMVDNQTQCILQGFELIPKEEFNYSPSNWCIERSFDNDYEFEFYFIDPDGYIPNVYYSCDSIEINNTILKDVVVTIKELKKNNFVISYP